MFELTKPVPGKHRPLPYRFLSRFGKPVWPTERGPAARCFRARAAGRGRHLGGGVGPAEPGHPRGAPELEGRPRAEWSHARSKPGGHRRKGEGVFLPWQMFQPTFPGFDHGRISIGHLGCVLGFAGWVDGDTEAEQV